MVTKWKNIRYNVKGCDLRMRERIKDSRYGSGTIKKVEKSEEGYWLTVLFDDENIGEKKFLSFVNPLENKEDGGIA